jgi:MFS family permease
MATTNFIPSVLRTLPHDGWLLLVTRFARLFAYGSLSVILVFYLVGLGLKEAQAGLVLTLTLVGDVVVSLYLTTRADRIGRRRMLFAGSILMAAAGLAFACTSNLLFLVVAGTIGVISPSGHEVGPFLSIEQAALSHIVPAAARTEVFAWYTLAGSLATVQSFAAYWFYLRFGVQPAALGAIFFWANVFAGISALLASRLAARIGLIRTMVVTHLPSNILLILVPLMPNLPLAVLLLLLRFSISQMDVPTRQSYTMAVVPVEERSAAGGFTGVARTTGAAISPLLAGFLFARPSLISAPFYIAGTSKIIYDLLLYFSFQKLRHPEES